jgi:DNA polymerase-1
MTTASQPPLKHLYLVDGSGYIFRAYFAIPPRSTSGGIPTNAVFGFTNMLVKLLRESDCDGLAIVFDHSSKSFRNELYPAYKAQRPEPPEDLRPQFAAIREATRAFALPCIEKENYEADDIIATLARRAKEAGVRVTVVTSDKDFMQLVAEGIELLDPIKQRPIGPAEVLEKFGVAPERVIDVQALAGDSVDNVPGVPGIGVKTAAQLITEYGDLETLLARAGEIKQPKRRETLLANAEAARISKRLVTLDHAVPLAEELADFGLREPDPATLRAFLEKYEFRSVLTRLADKLATGDVIPDERETRPPAEAPAGAGAPAPAAQPPRPRAESGPADASPPEAELPDAGPPIDRAKYELVQEVAALERWIAEATELGLVAVDTETTGLDPLRAELVGVSLATGPGRACYIPLRHGKLRHAEAGLDLAGHTEPPTQIPVEQALALLRPLLEDPGVLKVLQNAKYDCLVFAQAGIALAPFDDTMLISYALEGGLHGHGMDELSELHLGHKPIAFAEVAGSGKAQLSFDRVALDKALAYAAEDAEVTLRLWRALKPLLPRARVTTVYETLERPLVAVLARMESHGIKVDPAVLRALSNDFAQRLEVLETEIHALAGAPFAIGSPKQLGEVLFDRLGLQTQAGERKTKTGAYATGAEVLEELAAQGHALPARVLDWRQLAKLKSTYTDALQTQINPRTGRIHTSYSQAVASTGRLSSNDPNLQNIPIRTEEGRKIRRAFIAEEGFSLLSVDYSQIELRLTAAMADVPGLKQAFAEGKDIHAMTASQVFGVPLDKMDPETRRRAKAINFGIIYGISAFGLATNLRIPNEEARDYIKAYFQRYPEIRAYMDRTKKQAHEQGYVTTLFGRKVHIPAIRDKNPARRAFGERAAINAPIQGTAADIIKRAMIRLEAALTQGGLRARMLLQVHDELIFEVPAGEEEATRALVKRVMEGAAAPAVELAVPLVADAGFGHSWAEAH